MLPEPYEKPPLDIKIIPIFNVHKFVHCPNYQRSQIDITYQEQDRSYISFIIESRKITGALLITDWTGVVECISITFVLLKFPSDFLYFQNKFSSKTSQFKKNASSKYQSQNHRTAERLRPP